MKEIGKAETIKEYEEQIDYFEDILCVLKDLEILYEKSKYFKDEYIDTKNAIQWIVSTQQELIDNKEELVGQKVKEYDKELAAMNAEFERSRL